MAQEEYDYDLIVIGGGSGGLQSSKLAAKLGARVAVFDFVKPSTQGTTWGLGGTCVNVGCIPKKLMHTAALRGEQIEDSTEFGWQILKDKEGFEGRVGRAAAFNWQTLVENVQTHIKSLNWGYRNDLKQNAVVYYNMLASFIDEHRVEAVDKKGEKHVFSSRYFIIAVGGRPKLDDNIPGVMEFAISSDDMFSLPNAPGRTLVVGGGYVALECAGFLTSLGFEANCMVRSVPLRGFDRQCADMIKEHMELHGTQFLQPCIPTKIEKLESGKLLVHYKNTDTNESLSEQYDTVLYATGRYPLVQSLNLEKIGVKLGKSGKIAVNDVEQTSVPTIYAIGDVIEGGLELTPVAVQAGKLLALRLFGKGTTKMDYKNVPTTVFTPLEYGCIGMSEEEAAKKFGKENLEVYYKKFFVLEDKLCHKENERLGMAKLICNKLDKERVVGFHFLGPNAGEVTQGFGVAIRLGATKEDFDATVGIHPTSAEVLTVLEKGVTMDTGC